MVLIGDVIASIRRGKRIDQKDLAKKLSLSVSYLSQVENNKRTASIKLMKDIAFYLGVPVSKLVSECLISEQIDCEASTIDKIISILN